MLLIGADVRINDLFIRQRSRVHGDISGACEAGCREFMNKKIKIKKGMTGQDIQDELFRRMSVGKRIKLASEFYKFAQELHGAGRTSQKARPNS